MTSYSFYFYSQKKKLSYAELNQFSALLPSSAQSSLSLGRRSEFYTSRMALLKNLKRQQRRLLTAHPISVSALDLGLHTYHHLKSYPAFLVCLSHTSLKKNKNLAPAGPSSPHPYAAISVLASTRQDPQSRLLSLGVDLENASRKINSKILRHIQGPLDQLPLGISLLQFWTMKEASFKACAKLLAVLQTPEGDRERKMLGMSIEQVSPPVLTLKDIIFSKDFTFGLNPEKFPLLHARILGKTHLFSLPLTKQHGLYKGKGSRHFVVSLAQIYSYSV